MAHSKSSSVPALASGIIVSQDEKHPPLPSQHRSHLRVEFARSISAIIVSSIHHHEDDNELDDEDEDGVSGQQTPQVKGCRERQRPLQADECSYNERERRQDRRVIKKILERASKNKPKDSDFRQQRLEAWEPILTASTVLPSFLLIGLVFIPIGIHLFHSSEMVREFVSDYTDCHQVIGPDNKSTCSISFTLHEDFTPDVYLYYILQNYHQSHRLYASSRDNRIQLAGIVGQNPASDCEPFRFDPQSGKAIAPCGIVANSMFNDTFDLEPDASFLSLNPERKGGACSVKINRTNIAWVTDKAYRYRNPVNMSIFEEWVKPPNWAVPAHQLDPSNPDNNGFMNEHFLVWMRVGAFPTVRKLYGRVFSDRSSVNVSSLNHTKLEEGLPAGNYTMRIGYHYDVRSFSGRKLFVLTTTSWFGGKSSFLGIAYIVVGCLIVMLTGFLFFVHRAYGIKEGMKSA